MIAESIPIDHGRAFDWGRTSHDYAKYRDIYPERFYDALLKRDLCTQGQRVLDIGTGTGVLPRNLYRYGAAFTGVDSSQNQIAQAQKLAGEQGMDITFRWEAAEECRFPDQSFDVATACQCFSYFQHAKLAPHLSRLLKPGGKFAILYMAWLPLEDEIAGKSEELILRYHPQWTGCKEERRFISVPEAYFPYFTLEEQEIFDVSVPFTRESWNGRIKSCRGIGASLSDNEIAQFDKEHRDLLERIAPESFSILHYAAITVMRNKGTTA